MSQIKWLCYGDAGLDVYPQQTFLGGISLNHLWHLNHLGEELLYFYGPLSSTSDGKDVLKELYRLGVNVINEEQSQSPLSPPTQKISHYEDGEKSFDCYEGEIFKDFKFKRVEEDFDVLLMPCFSQNVSMVKDLLESPPKGDIIVDILDGEDYDLSFFATYGPQISMVTIGCPRGNSRLYDQLKDSTSHYPWRLLVTRGDKEGFFFDGCDTHFFSPKPLSAVVDSTGAGDAFLSGFLHKLYGGHSVGDSLGFATRYTHQTLLKLGPH